jgi:hypothetical protein
MQLADNLIAGIELPGFLEKCVIIHTKYDGYIWIYISNLIDIKRELPSRKMQISNTLSPGTSLDDFMSGLRSSTFPAIAFLSKRL